MVSCKYPWKRFWCPSSGSFSLADDGYLVDPEGGYAKAVGSDVIPFQNIADVPCLTLLGEPGIGKSTAIEQDYRFVQAQVAADGDATFFSDLGEYGDESRLVRDVFASETVRSWLEGHHVLHLFLDSLDECRMDIPNVARLLMGELRKHRDQVRRLRLRIACRTADWPSGLGVGLTRLFGQEAYRSYELVPLRRRDVEAAACAERMDVAAFMNEIARAGAEPLAIKPTTVLFLLRVFQRQGALPATQGELYRQGCLLLCTESRQAWRASRGLGPLSAKARLAVAKRVAAAIVFCNRAAIYTGVEFGDADSEDILLAELAGGSEEAAQERFPVREDDVREALGTALFSGRGADRLGFAHKTYAEFLAASYVVDHNLDRTQKLSLIQHPEDDEGRVVPQLAQAVAWLGGMDGKVLKEVMRVDPQVALRSDIAPAHPDLKASLINSLLRLFEAGKLSDSDWGIYHHYSKLSHPGLADQLRPFIQDRAKSLLVRRIAIDLSEACRVAPLQELLADVALDASEAAMLREEAAHAVAVIGSDEAKARLRALALGQGGPDPRDQLKGSALRALWPDLLSAEVLFANLPPPKRQSLHGAYVGFLSRDLLPGLRPDDLPSALDWIAQQSCNAALRFWIRRLIDGILLMAWEHMARPGVLPALARAAASRYACHDGLIGDLETRKATGDQFAEEGKRRALLFAIISEEDNLQAATSPLVSQFPHLARAEDLPWLAEMAIADEPPGRAEQWAELAEWVFCSGDREHLEAILRGIPKSPSLAKKFARILEPVALDSPRAARMRESFQDGQRRRREQGERPVLDWLPRDRVAHYLQRFEDGELDAWWVLNREMTLEDTSTHYGSGPSCDLTLLPGWRNADENTRQRIAAAAHRYILERAAKPEEWLAQDKVYFPDLSAYKAFLLLAKTSPAVLTELQPEVWRKWAPVFLADPWNPPDEKGESVRLKLNERAYDHAPDEIIRTILAIIDDEDRKHGRLFILDRLHPKWDARLCNSLLAKGKLGSLKPSSLQDLLRGLLKHGCEGAQAYASSLVRCPAPQAGPDRECVKAAAVALLTCGTDSAWEVVWPVVQAAPEFGKELLGAVAEAPENQVRASLPSKLSEEHLASLFVWLARQFPYAEDPDRDGAHSVGRREMVERLRNGALDHLENRGTRAACEAIARVSRELPELAWLPRVLLDAKAIMLRKAWQPLTPKQLLEFTSRPRSRLVQSGRHLLQVLRESLARLDAKLQGETRAAPALWNETSHGRWRPKAEPWLSDYIKLHLEEDLKACGIAALREVEIWRAGDQGLGERTDIHVTAVVRGRGEGGFDRVKTIIEVKGCWHRDVKDAMRTQLRDRYLRHSGCRHGLYVVGWFGCDRWDRDDPRWGKSLFSEWLFGQAQEYFADQADRLSDGHTVLEAFVLRTSLA